MNLMAEVRVSKQSLLISRLVLIIDLEVLACLLLFFMVMKLIINLSTLNYLRLLVLGSVRSAE